MTDAELRSLLADALALWDVPGLVQAGSPGVAIDVGPRRLLVSRAPASLRPIRWLLATPEREAAGRPPRAAPSVVALLEALRHALGAAGGEQLRVGD